MRPTAILVRKRAARLFPPSFPPVRRAHTMLGRIFNPRPIEQRSPTRTALSYSQFDLALLSLCAQAIAYYARTGEWPKLAPHTTDYAVVWP